MIQLSSDDFVNAFNIQYPDIVLIYFKQSNCDGCNSFDPIYFRIEKEKDRLNLSNVQFAVVNLTFNKLVINKAKTADIIIDKTPTLILFYKHRAYAKYNGPLQDFHIVEFIRNVITNEIKKNELPSQASNRSQHFFQQQQQQSYPMQFSYPQTKSTTPPGEQALLPSVPPQPVYMSQIKNNRSNRSNNHIYTDETHVGLFDNWNFLIQKDTPWKKDMMF